MTTNLLINVPLKYWQDFQDALAKAMDVNLYVIDNEGNLFSSFSQEMEICKNVNNNCKKVCNNNCITFYKKLIHSLNKINKYKCPYGANIFIYPLRTPVQNIGYLVISPLESASLCTKEKETAFIAKSQYIYKTVDEVLKSNLEKNLLGLQRLTLNSIYEISRLLTLMVDLNKVIGLIINSLVIIYNVKMVFIGLHERDKIKILQAKGEQGDQLANRELPKDHPLITKLTSRIEPSIIKAAELKSFVGLDINLPPDDEAIIYPLWSLSNFLGVLCLVFSPETEDVIENKSINIYANFASIALANAMYVKELKIETQLEPLTSLYNKQTIYEILDKELRKAAILNKPLSIIMIDIDDFKRYNDTFGHLAGDTVLQKTGEIIKASIRGGDYTGRYGGEEFLVILPDTNEQDAVKIAERIRRKMETCSFAGRKVTISHGVAVAENADSAESLIDKADKALYEAKRLGKNRVSLWKNDFKEKQKNFMKLI